MTDQTLPMKGGWVMVKRLLPTQIQVPLLSVFYAMPDKLFVKGYFEVPAWSLDHGHLKSPDLVALYKWRNGARSLMAEEVERAKKLDAKGVEIEQRVRILAPDGEVWVEPYEWTPIPDISKYFGAIGKGMTLHEYGQTVKISGRMEEQVFYMQQRGIPRARCLEMLLGEVKKQDSVWLETDQELIDFFFRPRDRKRTTTERMQVHVQSA